MRKTKMITLSDLPDTNRDKGKVFLLTEMPSDDAERWATNLIHGLTKSGVDVPDDIMGMGLAGVATLGLKALAGLPEEKVGDLMDRLMACVEYIPDPNRPEIKRGGFGQRFLEGDIEEFTTRFRLKKEVFILMTGFSMAAVRSVQGTDMTTALN